VRQIRDQRSEIRNVVGFEGSTGLLRPLTLFMLSAFCFLLCPNLNADLSTLPTNTWVAVTPTYTGAPDGGQLYPQGWGNKGAYDPATKRVLVYDRWKDAVRGQSIYANALMAYDALTNTVTVLKLNNYQTVPCLPSDPCSSDKPVPLPQYAADPTPVDHHPWTWFELIPPPLNAVYLLNGANGAVANISPALLSTTWKFNLGTGAWSVVSTTTTDPNQPPNEYSFEMGLIYDPLSGKLLDVAKAPGSNGAAGLSVYEFDPGTNKWSILPSDPSSLSVQVAGAGFAYDSRRQLVMVFGGDLDSSDPGTPHLWSYSHASNQWHQLADAPVGVMSPGFAYDSNHDIFLALVNNNCFIYDPKTNAWSSMASSLAPNANSVGQGHSVTYDPANDVFVFEGGSNDVPVWEVFRYSGAPSAPTITQQPVNVSTTTNGIAALTVYAAGSPAPTYQWQSNSGSGWAAVSGATAAVYLKSNVQLSDSGTQFRCVVSNSQGTVTSNTATLTVTNSVNLPPPPPSGGVFIGQGCTTAFHIDKDCDGYGVGLDPNDPNPLLGPDADDNDAAVNTSATMISQYGSLTAFLDHKGYPHARIFYIDVTNGNDADAATNCPAGDTTTGACSSHPYQHFGALAATYHDGAGGVFVFRAGTYNGLMNSMEGCHDGFPCYDPSANSASAPMIMMAYPGEEVTQNNQMVESSDSPFPNVANFIIDGIRFINTGTPQGSTGLQVTDASNITIRNVELAHWDQGFFVGNHSDHITVEDSVSYDNIHDLYTGGELTENNPGGDFNFPLAASTYDANLCQSVGNPYCGYDEYVTYHRNVGYGSYYDSIHINTAIRYAMIDSNIVHNSVGSPVSFQTGVYSSTITNNLFFNFRGACAVTFNTYPQSPTDGQNTIRWNTISNNTFWGPLYSTGNPSDPKCGIRMVDDTSMANGVHYIKDNLIINNIIVTDSVSSDYKNQPFWFQRGSFPNTQVIKNNLLWNNDPGGDNTLFTMSIDTNAYPSEQDIGDYNWSAFSAYSSSYTNNIQSNPLFTHASLGDFSNPTLYDFSLSALSRANGAGTSTGAPTYDLRGVLRPNPPSMGAYDSSATGVVRPPPPTGGGGNPPVPVTTGSALAVRVYPNPWRSDKHAAHPTITFAGLTVGTTIKLFTVSGHKVKELRTDGSMIPWDLTNDSGDKVASGIYLYVITDSAGDKVKGKVAIIR